MSASQDSESKDSIPLCSKLSVQFVHLTQIPLHYEIQSLLCQLFTTLLYSAVFHVMSNNNSWSTQLGLSQGLAISPPTLLY